MEVVVPLLTDNGDGKQGERGGITIPINVKANSPETINTNEEENEENTKGKRLDTVEKKAFNLRFVTSGR